MKKSVWLEFKEEVVKIRQEIARLNSAYMFSTSEPTSFEGFAEGTLLHMTHRMNLGGVTKTSLKEALSHFGKVAYVDVHGKVAKQVTIRFATKAQAISFLAKASDCDSIDDIDNLKSQKLAANEAFKKVVSRVCL